MNKGLLFIVSGPSGAGKGTICEQVLARTGMVRSVSVTTRAKREHEQEGLHYFFRTEEQYRQMIADGEFFETAEVFNHFYGTDVVFYAKGNASKFNRKGDCRCTHHLYVRAASGQCIIWSSV